ncbi:flagellar filament capping protein FliD [Clostridium folliculivorans]|uniref:Flagellar hook-associated protein 2 n=1 Tax=Clostridium folliculivorans TaxID=2886038 RepID=A0A9W5XZ47_9CLOT|nr:flagellar filament capping protein FliD [Clostridium folliculivorans]GKU23561.1 hypothetical protein CFOLD11_03870 [Clostridium folliculivorans]GKU29677.1 hypothetical protein CFB3_17840 [Clostridium folliculivorans]
MNISGASGSSSSTTDYTRITGMASGLDVDGLVKQALSADQTKIDKVKQDSQYVQWQQEAYVGYIKDLKDFANSFDILQADNMMTSSTYTGTSVSTAMASTGVAGDNYLTASTYPGAVKGNYQVKINNLAGTAKSQRDFDSVNVTLPSTVASSITSQSIKLNLTDTNGNTTSTSIDFSGYAGSGTADDITQYINDQLKAAGASAKVNATNSNGVITFTSTSSDKISVDSSTKFYGLEGFSGKVISGGFNTSTKLSDLGIGANSTINIQVDPTDPTKKCSINLSSTDTVNDLMNKLKNTYIGSSPLYTYINVNYSELNNKLTIESKNTGSSSGITISDTSGLAAQTLGIAGTFTGTDASVSIKAPGEVNFTQVTKGSNSFTLDNITYNLQNATAGDTVNLSVKADASSAVDKFKKFIDKYNTLIDKINTSITQKKNYDYKPLTDTQKSSMTADQITAWETKAKEGILRRDDTLSNLVSTMRQAVYDTVNGAGLNITDIGITTTSNYMDGGKLTIDETKLKTAIEQKGDLVKNLFTKSGTANTDKGIFVRFKDALNNVVGTDGTLIKKAGYINSRWVSENDLTKSIAEKTQKIKDMQDAMKTKQQQLYNMYSTLETNMNKLNSQSSWLSSAMSG